MTEWGVVGVLASLVGLAATLSAPMIKLNTTLTRLAVLVEELSDKLAALERDNSSVHSALTERIDRVRSDVNTHETRITLLEKDEGKNANL